MQNFDSCNRKNIMKYIFPELEVIDLNYLNILNDKGTIIYSKVMFRVVKDINLLIYKDYYIAFSDPIATYLVKDKIDVNRKIILFSLPEDYFLYFYIDMKYIISNGLSIIENADDWNYPPKYLININCNDQVEQFLYIYYKRLNSKFNIDYNKYIEYMLKCIEYCKSQLLLTEL